MQARSLQILSRTFKYDLYMLLLELKQLASLDKICRSLKTFGTRKVCFGFYFGLTSTASAFQVAPKFNVSLSHSHSIHSATTKNVEK